MSWFRNLVAYRLNAAGRAWTAAHMAEALAAHTFKPCGELDMQSGGFAPPVEGYDLAYGIPGGHFFIALCTESKKIPKQVVDRVTKDRCAELEKQQGFKPGRKQTKETREQVIDELLPKAFTTRTVTRVWVDPAGGWLGIDTSSPSRADEVFKSLLRALEALPVEVLHTKRSPVSSMTDWLASLAAHDDDGLPFNFSIDDAAELRATGGGKATVRYSNHNLETDDTYAHIQGGKQCTRLALTWSDRVSFVLTEGLILKQVAPLDILKENTEANEDERRDTDLVLMVGEFGKMLGDLVEALGGEEKAA